jgi:putative oxidoreductase
MSNETRTSFGRILLLVGRLALAAVFLVAAYAKLKPQGPMPWSAGSLKTSLAMFAMQVDSYQLLPVNAVNFVAHALPPFELFLGLWLFSGIALRFSSLITTLLLGGFFGVMVRTFSLGLEVSCGCFGPGEQLGTKTLLRDGSLLALSLAVCIGAFLIHRNRGEEGGPVAAVATPQRAD